MMCDACVHKLRRRGGKVHTLCPKCSHLCKPVAVEKKKKKSLLGFLAKTLKLPLIHTGRAKRGRAEPTSSQARE
jgi:hypothetical protein